MISYFFDLPESLIFRAPAGIKMILSLIDISCLVVKNYRARVVELVDTQDLGSCAAMRGGSSPFSRTNKYTFLKKWNESEKEKSLESVSSREKKLKSLVSEDLDTYKEKIDSRLETILRGMNIEVNNNSIPFKQLRMSFIDLYLMRFEWMRDLINFTGREDDDFRMEVDEKLKMNLFPELITQNKNNSQTST